MATRRDALVTLVAGSASAALARQTPQKAPEHTHETAAEAAHEQPNRAPQFFQGSDYQTITRLSDLIIPRTGTPGASDAGVPWRLDQAVSRNPDLQTLYTHGLASVNSAAKEKGKADFLSLSEEDQIAVLKNFSDAASTPDGEFFQSLKALTIEWYYKSEAGLVQELGFKGNIYRTEFPGCTHPEHWPVQKG